MKKTFVLLFLLIAAIGAAQNGISYQAVLLNPNGEQLPGADNSKIPLVNSSICLRFSIAASLGGTPEYQETITTRTDAFGMVNVTIGTGNPTPGSPSFSTISWGSGPKHLKVELDLTGLCTSFITVSDQPFTSVPFALYALNSGSGGGSSTTTLTGDVSGTGTGTIATSLATTGVIAGVYGSATAVPTITVDSKGRITSATTTPIAGGSPIGSSLNNGNIIIGNNSNVATAVPVTGDVTITNTGVTAIGTGKVTDAKLDKTNIPLSGFGAASANVALGGNKLSGVADPTLAQDAATKNYVDVATGAITNLTNGNVYIGNSSNVATAVPVTGDVIITNAGVTTIGTGKVTDAKLDKTNIPLSGFGAASANVALGGNKLSGVADPTLAQDAATKNYVDAATGAITNLTNGNVYIGNSSNVATSVPFTGDVTITNAGVTTIGTGKVTDAKLDKTNIPLSGFGAASANVALGGNKLSGVADPTLAQDAATKNYVDSATGAITNLTNGNVYIGNSSNVATAVPVTGDVTITNTGVTAIGTGKVTDGKLDKTNIPLSGFGAAVAAVDLGSNKLTNVTDPTLAQDAATKSYVDSATGTINTLADGKIYLGNASNVATEVTMNGDVTISNTGATTIVPNAVTSNKIADSNVTNAKLQNSSMTINGNTVTLGGTATINASPVGTALTSGNVLVGSASNLAAEVTMNGDVTISNTGATTIVPNAVTSTKIADSNVTNAKLQNSSITINGNTVALGGTATINASPIGTALTSGNVLVGSASNLAAEVTMNGDVTISNTGATTIVPNAVTSTKIQDGTITNDDINSAAAIQTTKIKGFYTGNYKTNVSSTTNGVEIKLSDLSIPPLNSNSTIIIHSNTTNLSIKSSVPVDDDSDVTNFELINVSFPAIGSNTIISLSYIIIIN
jgi:hypothetical protein